MMQPNSHSSTAAAAKSLQLCPTLCDPLDRVAPQAPPSLGFSRQEYWSGLPFPSPMQMKEESESEVTQSCPTLRDIMYCGPPGSSAHGIFQARVLEWVDIAFSNSSTNHHKIHSGRKVGSSHLQKALWSWAHSRKVSIFHHSYHS